MKPLSEFFNSGSSGADYIAPPQSVDGVCCPLLNSLPALANDGSYITLPKARTGGIGAANCLYSKYDKNGNIIWTVTVLDVDADHAMFLAFQWYDTVDQALWVMTANAYPATPITETTLAKIDDATGAVTVIGTQANSYTGTSNRLMTFTERAAHGSGDFYFKLGLSEYTISAANGSILTGPTAVSQNGISVLINTNYRTTDGNIVISGPTVDSNGRPPVLDILRGGGRATMFLNPHYSTMAVLLSTSWVCCWQDFVALSSANASTAGAYDAHGPRFFVRTDFDRWLNDLADALALPETV